MGTSASQPTAARAACRASRLVSMRFQFFLIYGAMIALALALVAFTVHRAGTVRDSAAALAAGHAAPSAKALAHVHDQASGLVTTLCVVAGIFAVVWLVVVVAGLQVVEKSNRELSEAFQSIVDGDLHPKISFPAHDHDASGRIVLRLHDLLDYLRSIASHARRVADGDLTAQLPVRSDGDELGLALAQMTESLRDMVIQISHASDTVSAASQQLASDAADTERAVGEISSAMGEVTTGAERQVEAVEGVRRMSDDVAEAMRQSADGAQEASAEAERAHTIAHEGSRAVVAASDAMGAVREASDEVTLAIRSLGERSTRIGTMVDTIGGIAQQTNLLALNAAIEAARAGEDGRGFAVVADEVRKLAEESQAAARSIAELVTEIRAETDRAVDVVEEGARRTEDGVGTVQAARDAFRTIGEAVAATSARVSHIAAAVQDVAGTSTQMTQAISEVAAVAEQSSAATQEVAAGTQQSTSSAQQIAASAQELSVSAEELRRLAARFTVA
jgi:methyl-accepting chemotaxis protein